MAYAPMPAVPSDAPRQDAHPNVDAIASGLDGVMTGASKRKQTNSEHVVASQKARAHSSAQPQSGEFKNLWLRVEHLSPFAGSPTMSDAHVMGTHSEPTARPSRCLSCSRRRRRVPSFDGRNDAPAADSVATNMADADSALID